MRGSRGVAFAIALLVAVASARTVRAQAHYVDSACGAWLGNAWVSNGSCGPVIHRHERIVGTIRSVNGHRVVVVRPSGVVTLDDRYASILGRVAAGRAIVAHGYWDAGNYYATIVGTTIPRRR